MTQFSIPVTRGTGTDSPIAFDLVTGTGTASDINVQQTKTVGATGNMLGINAAGAAIVQHVSSATIGVSLTTFPTSATVFISGPVQLGVSATVPVAVSSAATLPVVLSTLPSSATLPITGVVGLGVSATVPVSVSSAATLAVSSLVRNTATGPVIVQHVTSATAPVSLTTLPTTATIPITGVVGLGVSATVPVSVSSAATLPVVLSTLPSSATIPITGSLSLGTAATLAVVITNSGLPSSATIPITGSFSFSSGPTMAVAVQNTATVIISATGLPTAATLAITGLVQLGVSATVPVSMTTFPTSATVFINGPVQLGVSATVPVSVSSAATLPVSVSTAATFFVLTSSAATMFVSLSSAATIPTQVRGLYAHDSAVGSGNPLWVAGVAFQPSTTTATDTVNANGDVARVAVTRDGVQYVVPTHPMLFRSTATLRALAAGVTDVQVVAAPPTGMSLYITGINLNFQGANSATMRPYISIGTGAASTILQGFQSTGGNADPITRQFLSPIKCSASTPLFFSSTATEAGFAFVSITGFVAP